jgi:hypothetical protein
MKNLSVLVVLLFTIGLFFSGCQDVNQPEDLISQKTTLEKPGGCATIQGGTITDVNGDPITVGYDKWGYNYQALMFNGRFCDYDRGAGNFSEYCNLKLMMKWNEAWLSNKDCTGDGKLDRHFGVPSYKGSGAWLTNHISGTYEYQGQTCEYKEFVKIVAVPIDANKVNDIWYQANGTEIGPVIWGEFAIIQQSITDPCGDFGGYGGNYKYKSPDHPGLGNW